MPTIKLLITAKTALQQKYGADFAALDGLLNSLIPADANRPIQTQLFYIDDQASMAVAGAQPVNATLPQSCKAAVDLLYHQFAPAYIVIFGAQDVIPFQPLDNPTKDEDTGVPSDLPYACDSDFSTDASTFIGPTRVVGRIPDIPGKGDINYVKTLIQNIIGSQPQPVAAYIDYFAVSAAVWTNSTQMSVTNMFGNTNQLLICPPDAGSTNIPRMKSLSHFYNCHGANLDYNFYGQSGDDFPPALNTADLDGNLTSGCVVATESCHGAQLIDGNQTGNPNLLSIANNYFLNNAIGLVGSSTIAYGPDTGNDQADLITQFFLISVLTGSSTGRALLEARQKYLTRSGPHLDAFALKTLAQFYLLGDPSLQPVISQAIDQKGAVAVEFIQDHRIELAEKGMGLSRTIITSKWASKKTPSPYAEQIQQLVQQNGFDPATEELYVAKSTRTPAALRDSLAGKTIFGGNIRYRTFINKEKAEKAPARLTHIRVLVIKENDNGLLGYKIYLSR